MSTKEDSDSFFSRVWHGMKTILICMAGTITYGIINDAITTNIEIRYFTEGFHFEMLLNNYKILRERAGETHRQPMYMLCRLYSHLLRSNSKIDHTLFWGVAATWWVGLGLGIVLALCTQIGRNPIKSGKLIIPIAIIISLVLVSSIVQGLLELWSSLENPNYRDRQFLSTFGEGYLLCSKINFFGYRNGFWIGLAFCLLCVLYRFGYFNKFIASQ
jgi:hypothetical protein